MKTAPTFLLLLFFVTQGWAEESAPQIGNITVTNLDDYESHTQFDGFFFVSFSNRTTFVVGKPSNNVTSLLGLGESVAVAEEPKELEPLRGEDVAKILMCTTHAVALTKRGKVFTWGENVFGQLGVGLEDEKRIEAARQVKSIKSVRVKDIACGEHHTVIVAKDGDVWSWGGNDVKQLGANRADRFKPVPVKVRGLKEKAKQISAAGQHSLTLDDEHDAYAWGDNQPVMRIEMQQAEGEDDRIKVKAIEAGKDGQDYFLVKGDKLFVRLGVEQVATLANATEPYESIAAKLKQKDD